MLKSGNGLKQVCVHNLLQIIRGEVCFDRIRGLDTRNIDRPAGDAATRMEQDARWLLETYEPRAIINSIEISQNAVEGDFGVTANIT